MPPRTQLEPDILVYPARYPIDSKWEEIHEHWLAVEVSRVEGPGEIVRDVLHWRVPTFGTQVEISLTEIPAGF